MGGDQRGQLGLQIDPGWLGQLLVGQAQQRYQQALAANMLEQWQTKDGMLAQLQSFPNQRYAEAKEAITAILRSQVTGLESMKKKLGTPLGRQTKGLPQPYQAEAWRSNASLSNLLASLGF